MGAGREARVRVDPDRCVHTLQCTYHAPAVFDVDENGELVHAEHVSARSADAADNAADLCPSRAITVTRHTVRPTLGSES